MAEGRGGVVKKFLDHITPSARTNEASRLFLNRATTWQFGQMLAFTRKWKVLTAFIFLLL